MGPTFEQDWPGASARATDCVMNILLTAERINERMKELMRPFALTPAAGQVLSIIHGAGEPLPHHVVAERLVSSRGTVTWLVDGLERCGLVRRIPHPTSRRTVLVALTEEGERQMLAFRPRIHQLDRELVADLNQTEQETLLELLGRVQARALALVPGHGR
jgi:DNA-binding MarR family transcriptional regulator